MNFNHLGCSENSACPCRADTFDRRLSFYGSDLQPRFTTAETELTKVDLCSLCLLRSEAIDAHAFKRGRPQKALAWQGTDPSQIPISENHDLWIHTAPVIKRRSRLQSSASGRKMVCRGAGIGLKPFRSRQRMAFSSAEFTESACVKSICMDSFAPGACGGFCS